MHEEVLRFWFREVDPRAWWIASAEFDARVRERFQRLLQSAALGELFSWRNTPAGRLAEIIVLDQFSRNICRDTAQAFAQDGMALVLGQEAYAAGAHVDLLPIERTFLFMPYMHSESRAVHVEAERLFREYCPADNHQYELRHKAIIDRFGRYPHRNEVLGRASTEEEREFLTRPGSRF